MREQEILDDLLKNNKITKEEYNKLSKDSKSKKEEIFIDSLFGSIKEDINKVTNYISKNIDVKQVSGSIKESIRKEIDKNKIQKLANTNSIYRAKAFTPIKEQKIVYKINKNINTFNINIPSDYVTIIGSNKKYIEITANFVVDDIDCKDILILKQLLNSGEITLDRENYIKYLNSNILIMLPHKYIKNINIKCESATYDIKKINLNNIFLNANNSYLKFKNNKINKLYVDMLKCDFRADKISCNNLSVVADKTKSNIKFCSIKNAKLNLNNSNFTLRGLFNHGTINVKLENIFSDFSYDKNKLFIAKKDNNLSYLRYDGNKKADKINLECKIISSILKIS